MNEHEQDKIDLMRGGEDRILGGALCSGTPVLFTRNLALITVTATDFSAQDFNAFVNENDIYRRPIGVSRTDKSSVLGHTFNSKLCNL